MESFDIPPEWWGRGDWWGREEPRSAIDLMENGTLDARLAALLWLAFHHGVSLVVVAGHSSGVGKTTLLTALLGFLAPDAVPVFTVGRSETFPFVGKTDPARTRIMVNELSDHLPLYLWGANAALVFALAGEGYALSATMHAESLDELVTQTEDPRVGVSRETFVARVPLAVLVAAGRRGGRLVRRVTSVLLLQSGESGIVAEQLSTWQADDDSYRFPEQDGPWTVLAATLGMPPSALHEEWQQRAAFLTALQAEGVHEFDAMRAAVVRYGQP